MTIQARSYPVSNDMTKGAITITMTTPFART